MTSFLRRLLSPLAVVALTALPGRASAITENYCRIPTSLTTFTLNGNAFEAQQSVIRLTDSPNDHRGGLGVHHHAAQPGGGHVAPRLVPLHDGPDLVDGGTA